LETGGMMFERSEFLPPQALRQAASGEVWTDWKMSQSDSWTKEAPNAVHDCPVFGTFLKKVQKERLEEKYKWTIKVEDCCRIWRRAKASFLSPNFCRWTVTCCFVITAKKRGNRAEISVSLGAGRWINSSPHLSCVSWKFDYFSLMLMSWL
jgi:hypothetical protein